jgi:hypothetical protein
MVALRRRSCCSNDPVQRAPEPDDDEYAFAYVGGEHVEDAAASLFVISSTRPGSGVSALHALKTAK